MQLTRRTLLQAAAALAAVQAPLKADAADSVRVDQLWPTYRDRFVHADGRVMDTGNDGISHSEGQGWGMLLAGAAGDWDAFNRIWNWTDANLRWSGAPLFAWKWDPKTSEVVDPNNASDGDILIAWALARAGYFTKRTDLVDAAKTSAVAVRRLLTDQVAGVTALPPGFTGFSKNAVATINLSYYVFPAFAHLNQVDPSPLWQTLSENGAQLALQARFGPHSLPPDWLAVHPNGQMQPAQDWPARFSFDAVRIPLYLYWAGYDSVQHLGTYQTAWAAPDAPAWFTLETGPNAEYEASDGVKSIAQLIKTHRPEGGTLWPAVKEGDYYSASLAMLSSLAAEERGAK
jgi:endoglucanase